MLNKIAIGVLKSRGERALNVLSEAPLPDNLVGNLNPMEFTAQIRASVREVRELIEDPQPFYGLPIVPQKSFRLPAPHSVQGGSTSVSELLASDLPPSFEKHGVQVAVGTIVEEPDVDEVAKVAPQTKYRRLSVFSCASTPQDASSTDSGKLRYLCVPADDISGAVRAAVFSEYLRACFPFTIWSSDHDTWDTFLSKVHALQPAAHEDEVFKAFGVPVTGLDGIEAIWAAAAGELLSESVQNAVFDANAVADFVASTWQHRGGAMKKSTLRQKFGISMKKAFAGHVGQHSNDSLLTGFLNGDAELVMTLNKPNNRQREQIKSLLQLPNWGKHRIGFIPSGQMDQLKGFFADNSLVRFDAKPLRYAHGAAGS